MDGTVAVTGSGFVLGLITAVSPCPLATNLAATVWLSRHAASRRRALLGALAYTAGRVAAYGAIAALLALGALGAPTVSHALQEWLPPFVGPLLVLTAMVLLELLPLPWGGRGMSQGTAERLARFGVLGEFALGFLFAMTFCPASAALFFGSLLPQALASPSATPPVVAYGIGTAIPIGVFAVAVAIGAGFASRFGQGIVRWQPRIRVATGTALLLLGLYLIARDTLGVLAS
jgi:cytochrome c biogenesis protein CcdA